MSRTAYLAVLTCFISALAWRGSAATVLVPNPDDGAVRNSVYTSDYFNLSYPLPSGWTEGTAGPGPSVSGYYVLSTFVPAGELNGTILLSAQDSFFSNGPSGSAMDVAVEFGRSMSMVDGMTIDRPPSEVRIAGRSFSRVDFSGVGLFRSALTTKIRCHFVSFNLTTKNPELLSTLVQSLNKISFAGDGGRTDPTCIGNYADRQHVLAKVDPAAVVPVFVPIPVRMIIGADGSVEHVHVIRATAGQRDSIERALTQWKFKPWEIDERAAEIETGLLIKFTPAGGISYLTDR